jgi:hypothetical protein
MPYKRAQWIAIAITGGVVLGFGAIVVGSIEVMS